jgi:hypothetical protein
VTAALLRRGDPAWEISEGRGTLRLREDFVALTLNHPTT